MRCLSPPCGQLQCTAVLNKNANRKPHVIRQHMRFLFFFFFLIKSRRAVALNVKMLIPLAAASLAVTSCSYSLFSSVCFKFAQVLSCFQRTLNRFLLTFQNNQKHFLREVDCVRFPTEMSTIQLLSELSIWRCSKRLFGQNIFFSVEQVKKKKVSVHPSDYLTMQQVELLQRLNGN